MANFLHKNILIYRGAEDNILLGFIDFFFSNKRLPEAYIKTLQQSLTSYKFLFSMNLAQANINHMILHVTDRY